MKNYRQIYKFGKFIITMVFLFNFLLTLIKILSSTFSKKIPFPRFPIISTNLWVFGSHKLAISFNYSIMSNWVCWQWSYARVYSVKSRDWHKIVWRAAIGLTKLPTVAAGGVFTAVCHMFSLSLFETAC